MYQIILKFKTAFRYPIDNIRLFNAIFFSLSLIDKSKAEEFKELVKNNEIMISSAFPVSEKNDKLLFPFPIHLKQKIISSLNDHDGKETLKKKVKKLEYINEEFFNINNFEQVKEKIISICERGERDFKMEKVVRLKTSLSRLDLSSNLYDTYYIFIPKLKFLLKCEENIFRTYIKPALDLLKCFGLGGDVNNGKGAFDYEVEENDITEKGDKFLLLSKLILEDWNEVPSNHYKLKEFKTITRDGYHIKGILYFSEGSVFSRVVDGSLIEFENIKYFVNGKGFFIRIPGW